ncbi:beta-galactosidase [Cellulomonas shaoxiangyii]|uniref:Beta-galactosidase n=1 Tax=Cellulomonas shaoxiangyii TaxID=2566013 RepID=A0A4P7SLV1_9CELL|nr:beta-galactosidase [Cellulomonas shaoxiangyii]QCB94517.1 beta-galactosidase [Cellulomonas shaoxiangyii]TGY86098.1 beta-galactosidase [Cellulomonas shaoxiangyii]
MSTSEVPAHLHVRPGGWSRPLTRPAMANEEDARPGLALTSRYLERDGRPWVPVSGEVHYARIPRERWRERLQLVRSGGVDVVSTYVTWIHHEPERGRADFTGGLDVAAFVRLAGELGLHVVLRVGPWVHGEVRNGGFPDWVQAAPVRHRTDDPAYLELVREWFGRLGEQLAEVCRPGGPVLAVQLDNELYDQPDHLVTLKRLAREAGIVAPLWTATAWGGAQLPDGEVLPLYGGYGDGFWVDADAGWHPAFRAHYLVSHTWDDPGIGADVRGEEPAAATVDRDESWPPATCELGGGMATAYHRRHAPTALDVATVAQTKLAAGSAWQGYYMYAGGTNPAAGLQESQATGYPNDVPTFDYDFHAPIGAAGVLAPSHAALRVQHAFLAAFGDRLATMPSTLPDEVPTGVDDAARLRWAVRADDDGTGFALLAWHQPHVALPLLRGVRLRVDLPGGPLVLPSSPVDVPPGTLARWPLGLRVGGEAGVRLRWATASALTELGDGTLVLLAHDGLPAEVAVDAAVEAAGDGWTTVAPGVHRADPRTGGLLALAGGAARVLVVGASDADRVWVVEGPAGRELLLADAPLWTDGDDVVVRSADVPVVRRWVGDRWAAVDVAPDAPVAGEAAPSGGAVRTACVRPAGDVPVSYGEAGGRASAPTPERVAALAAEHRLADVGTPVPGTVRLLRVDWAGDVAQLLVDGRVVADRFGDGSPWHVDLDVLDGAEGDRVGVRVLPLHPDARVWLPADAADRRRSVRGPLGALDAVSVARTTTWRAPLG